MKIKETLRSILPDSFFSAMRYGYYNISPRKRSEIYRLPYKIKSGDKNPELKFYIFRSSGLTVGILAAYRIMLSNIKWAVENGFIPVIDYELDTNYYHRSLNKKNIWEYCFRQPTPYSLEEALESKNVYVGLIGELREDCIPLAKAVGKDYKTYYQSYAEINNTYIKFNTPLQNSIDQEINTLFLGKRRILGVSLREQFAVLENIGFKNMAYHPKEPDIDQVLKITKDFYEKWGCDYIYLAVEMEDTIRRFCDYFGEDKILYIKNKKRLVIDKDYMNFLEKIITIPENKIIERCRYCSQEDKNSIVNKQCVVDYTKEIYLLSRCQYLIASKCGGTIASLIWNQGFYDDVYIFEDEHHSGIY